MTSRTRGWRGGLDRRWITLIVTTIASFMSILDTTIVNVALPGILKDFKADLGSGQLILTVYLLALAIVIPASGYMADRFGMKRIFMITLAGFTASSALCGLAWDLPSLIAFRAVQGLTGGMLAPLSQAIVFTTITPLERGRFMPLIGLPLLLAPILGPTVGGYLVQYLTWRLIFLINLPIGLVALGLAYRILRKSDPGIGPRFDARGFVLAAVAFPGLILGLSEGSDRGWNTPHVIVLLAAGTVGLIGFVWTELRVKDPLLQLRLFKDRMFSLAMAIMFVIQISLFGIQYLLPLFLQQARGMGAAEAGLVLLPGGIASFLAMNVGGRLYNRLGPRPLALAGLAILFVGTLGMAGMTADTSVPVIGLLSCIRGLALGICFIPVQTAAYNTVAHGQMPRATALLQVSLRLFGSISTAVMTTVLIYSLGHHGAPDASVTGGDAPTGVLVQAFSDAFLLMSALTVIAAVLSLFIHDYIVERATRAEVDMVAQEPLTDVLE